jgi:hypothetical protein
LIIGRAMDRVGEWLNGWVYVRLSVKAYMHLGVDRTEIILRNRRKHSLLPINNSTKHWTRSRDHKIKTGNAIIDIWFNVT